jgi:hypothetical protein
MVSKIITIITAYKPCTVTTNTGTTIYHQQLALQQSKTNATINPRKNFASDLLQWMKKLHQKGERFILGGDFHETLHSKSDMMKLCSDSKLHMVDILGNLNHIPFSTTKIGKSRIDYILISLEIVPGVMKMGHHIFDQLVYIDHRGMFIDLDTKLLFGAEHVKLVRENSKIIRTKDPKCVSKYITVLHKHLDENNFWHLIIKLTHEEKGDHELAERLDKTLIQACLHAEKKCKRKYSEWWSLPLIQARSKVHTLKVHPAKQNCNATTETK